MTQSLGHQDLVPTVPGTLQSSGSAGLAQSPRLEGGMIIGVPLNWTRLQLVIVHVKDAANFPGSLVAGAVKGVGTKAACPKLAS